MIFMVSYWIENHLGFLSNILQKIGKESFLIVAFSQIIVMLINEYFSLNAIFKYLVLVVAITWLVYMKNYINRIVKMNIL